MLEGEVILISESGEEVLHAGDCAGFKAGIVDGHHLQNRSNKDALILEIGTRNPNDDAVFYPDIDLQIKKGREAYSHKNGELYASDKPRNPETGK